MNALCYKIVFSKRLGSLVAVGEHTSGQGKTASGTSARSTVTHHGLASTLKTSALVIALSWLTHCAYASGPAANALPIGAKINSGNVAISTQGAAMTIQQTSDKASVNWNSFNIGSAAAVNITQPSANSVLLNRVVGNDPSQIFGKLSANGQVVLINPNGVVFGQGGSVTASAFTASTFGLSDDDFAKGKYNYTRNGSTAGVTVQNGSSLNATAPGGYVALIGASVNNEGTISTKQGSVVMAAGESAALQTALTDNVSVPLSGKVRLELSPSTINASVNNSGAITTDGGQVLMQAAAISDAVASISHSGSINTTSAQGGAVTLQADGGNILVSGTVTANSTDAGRGGGNIIIGRNEETGALAKVTDVSGAQLESYGGFAETSGAYLKATHTKVIAKEWLLDPTNITIAAAGTTPSGTTYAANYTAVADSVILASDISNSLSSGTSVTISTSASGASVGNIAVNESITKTGGADATLTLKAHGDIIVAAGKTITSNSGKLNVVFNSDFDGNGSGGIGLLTGSGITTNGGSVTLGGGTTGDGTGAAVGSSVTSYGITLVGASISTGSGNVSLNGASINSASNNLWGVNIDSGTTITTTTGNVNITATGQTTGRYGYGMLIQGASTKVSTGTGNITVVSTGSASAAGDSLGIQIRSAGAFTTNGGNISLTGTSRGTGGNNNIGINFNGSGSINASGNGTINIDGIGSSVGSNSSGIYGINATTSGGAANIKGVTTSNGTGAADIDVSNSMINTTGGNITFTANSYVGNGAEVINAGAGLATIQNRTAGTLINLGGVDASGTLGISNTELNRISASTTKIGSSNAGSLSVSSAITTTAARGNLYLLSNGTASINFPVNSGAGLFIQTTGGKITNASGAVLSGTNIAIDNTNGTINTSTSAINIGANSAIGTTAIDIGANITASSNLTLYGVTNNQTGINVQSNVTLSASNIQATGKTGAIYGIDLQTGSGITTIGASGKSLLTAVSSSSAGNGSGSFQLEGSNNITAATGTNVELNGQAIASAAESNVNTRGLRINGITNTYGDVTLTGSSKSSDGLLVQAGGTGGIYVHAGSLSINGKMTATGGGGLTGITLHQPIYLYNNTSLYIRGETANTSLSMTSKETGVWISSTSSIGQAADQTTAGDISITGYSSSYYNSDGVAISGAISTGAGNIKIIGQNLEGGSGTGVNFDANVSTTIGNITIQSIGGNIKQGNGSTLTGKNITIDNTGAGLSSLIADSTYSPIYTLAAGTSMGGYVDAVTGGITPGRGVRSDSGSADAINLTGGISATGNINIQGNTYKTTNIGVNLNGGATPVIKTSGSSSSININSNSSVTANIRIQGTSGANINLIAERDLLIQQAINTTNNSDSAVVLESGKSAAAGTLTGGDVKVTGSGAVSVGTGGRVTYLTGSIAGSALVGVLNGNNRYNSDELTTNYTAALGSGTYAIYREAPALTLQVNNVTKTYDGLIYSGGSISATPITGTYRNGDTFSIVTQNVSFFGEAQGKKNVADSGKTITASDNNGKNALGYVVTYVGGALTINKAALSVTATAVTKTYDGTTSATGSGSVGSIAGYGDSVSNFGSQAFTDKNSGTNKTVHASGVSIKDSSGSDMTGNYNISYIDNSTSTINKAALTLSDISVANKTYDGNSNASISNVTFSGFVASESLGISASGSFDSKNAGSRTATVSTDNIALSDNASSGGLVSNYNLVSGSKSNTAIINKAPLYLSASIDTKIYDNTTTSNATVKVSGLVVGDSANATQDFSSKNAMGSGGSTLHVNSDYVVNDGNGGNNYSVKLIDASGTIAPKVLIPIYSEISKKMDGTTQAKVEATPSNFGVIGADDVTIAQTASYDTPTAGTGKTVTVRNITLSGKDSANYTLKTSHTTTKGTIVAVPPIAVPPVVMPTKTSSDVSNSGASGHANARIAIGDINPFQLATVPSAVEDVCSSSNLEKCRCEDSPSDTSISFCYEPK